MKKKILSIILTAVVVFQLTACGTTETEQPTEVEEGTETVETTDEEQYIVGISQFAEHGSLDNCREGFIAGLAEAGIVEGENLTVQYDNAQTDMGTAGTIAESYLSQKVDLICGIATPSAMSAYNACLNNDTPVIYTAVSDPVGAGLANEDGTSIGNVTGTSDYLAVTEQMKMIRDILPDAKKIGIIYTTSEANSVSTIEEYKKYAADYGFEIVESGINTVADVELAATNLAEKVDCFSNMTDNTVVSALQVELAAANKAGIPVFGSEVEQVKSGCVASMGLEYYELGKQTGAMAAKVLKGEATADSLKFETISKASLYVNTKAAETISLTLEDALVESAFQKFDEITVE